MKIQKNFFFWGGGGEGLGGEEQGGCEWRSEAFVKIRKKKKFFLGGWGVWSGGGGSGWGVSGWMGMEN